MKDEDKVLIGKSIIALCDGVEKGIKFYHITMLIGIIILLTPFIFLIFFS